MRGAVYINDQGPTGALLRTVKGARKIIPDQEMCPHLSHAVEIQRGEIQQGPAGPDRLAAPRQALGQSLRPGKFFLPIEIQVQLELGQAVIFLHEIV